MVTNLGLNLGSMLTYELTYEPTGKLAALIQSQLCFEMNANIGMHAHNNLLMFICLYSPS